MATEIVIGSHVIQNNTDQPCTRLVAKVVKVEPEKNWIEAEYICRRTRMTRCCGALDRATAVEDFGVELSFVGNTVTAIQLRPSVATYPDGKPRDWQPNGDNPTQELRKRTDRAKAA